MNVKQAKELLEKLPDDLNIICDYDKPVNSVMLMFKLPENIKLEIK